MNTLTLTGQIVGFVAAALMILSFQFKENKKLFICQVLSTTLFSLHYMFLALGGNSNAFSGMAQNIGGLLIRIVMLLQIRFKWAKSPITMSLLCTYCAVMAALTYTGDFICILPTVGNIILIGAMWTNDRDKIRIGQFAVTTPSWLIYNFSAMSISGIITESFNLISIGIYYIRQAIKRRREKNELQPEQE